MKKLVYGIFSLGVLAAQGVGKPFDTIIATDADAMVAVRDVSDLRTAWREHPFFRDLRETSPAKYYASLFEQAANGEGAWDLEESLEAFGLDEEQLFALFPDQIAVVAYALPELILQKREKPDIAVIAEFSGTAERLEELMRIRFDRAAEAQREANPVIERSIIEERFMDETLFFVEVYDGEATDIEEGYALVDGVFTLTWSEERLRAVVESIKAEVDEPIARDLAYQRVREVSGPVDLSLYLNLQSIMPAFNEALRQQAKAGGMAMFGVTGQSLDAALSLQSLQAFSFDCRFLEEGIASHSAVVYREKAGLLELMSYVDGPLPAADFVPESVLSSTVVRFDLSECFARLEALLGVASPNTPALMNMQLQQVKTKTGVDLRSALLENFGSELVTFSMSPEGRLQGDGAAAAQEVYVLEIKDGAALSGAVEALKDLIPGARAQIETRDFEGETIHTITNPAQAATPGAVAYDFSFVVTRTHFILALGEPGLVQRVLSAMQSQNSGFWQLEQTQDLIDRIGNPEVVSRAYTDFGEVIAALLESIAEASQFSGHALALDPAEMPSAGELPWHMMTETYEADDGIFSETIMLRKEGP
jgi:hypothetical protein